MKKRQDSPGKEKDICSFLLPFLYPTLEQLVLKGGTEKRLLKEGIRVPAQGYTLANGWQHMKP